MNAIASMAVHRCTACGENRRRAEFWDADWANREQGAACKACQPAPPNERGVGQGHLSEALQRRNAALRIEDFTCAVCSKRKPRAEFWPGDIKSRFTKNYVLGCKECKPTPPNQRRARKSSGQPASSSSAGAS